MQLFGLVTQPLSLWGGVGGGRGEGGVVIRKSYYKVLSLCYDTMDL